MPSASRQALWDGVIRALVLLAALFALVLAPLLAGILPAEQRSIRIAIADLRAYPVLDDKSLTRELAAQQKSTDALILLLPQSAGAIDVCSPQSESQRQGYCAVLNHFPVRTSVTVDAAGPDPTAVLRELYGPGTAPEGGKYVLTAVRSSGVGFSMRSALKVGAIVAIVGTAALLAMGRSVRRWRPRTGGRTRTFPQPETVLRTSAPRGTGTAQRQPAPEPSRPATPIQRAEPVQRPVPEPQGRPSPARPAIPMPAELLLGCGPQVVARSHFADDGGYVVSDGVVLWATLGRLPDHPVIPGEVLTVLAVAEGHDSLVVCTADNR